MSITHEISQKSHFSCLIMFFSFFSPKLIFFHVVCNPSTHFGIIIYVIYFILWFIYVEYLCEFLSKKNNFCPIVEFKCNVLLPTRQDRMQLHSLDPSTTWCRPVMVAQVWLFRSQGQFKQMLGCQPWICKNMCYSPYQMY